MRKAMKRLVIQLWQTSADQPQRAATPFMIAAAAAAMETDVQIHALGQSVELFVVENDARKEPVPPSGRPLAAYIDDAMRCGVRIFGCSTAMRDRALSEARMIDGFSGVLGMVSMLEVSLDDDVVVMTF